MKSTNPLYKFVEWSSPEELHEASLGWRSELEFIKDEQQFLDSLIKNHTLQLVSGELYAKSVAVISELLAEEKEVTSLLNRVYAHLNRLEVLTDGVDQLEDEKSYKEEHYILKIEVSRYSSDYRITKAKIFDLIKELMKKGKQKRIAK
ncbi:MAG: hypothetical protein AAFP76_03105 [Bacteroidota bacterium]